MENVNPPQPNEPIKATFESTIESMVSALDAELIGPPKTDCEKAVLLREALLLFIEKNCPNSL